MKRFLVSGALSALVLAAHADSSWFQASLTPSVALHPSAADIRGVAVNVWGENVQHGFDLGIIDGSRDQSAGFSLGLVNYDESYIGLHAGLLNISKDSFIGLQYGLVNFSRGDFKGWQDGYLINISRGTITGAQTGYGINVAEDITGAQLGLVNYAEHLH